MKIIFLNYWVGRAKGCLPIYLLDISVDLGSKWGRELIVTLFNFRIIIRDKDYPWVKSGK